MKLVNNYLKNLTKSVAYAAADVAKEDLAPNVTEFASENKQFLTATYATLKNPKATLKKSVQAIQESKVYQALDYGTKNLFEDLRTGKWYNKEREERDELRLSGLGGGTDWDDLSEFGIDSDWESNLGKDSSGPKDEITTGDLEIIGAIEGSNAAAASATVNAVIRSSEAQIKTSRTNMGMIYMQNERLFGGLHKDFSVLNATMDSMNKVTSASLQNIDKNLSDFFTNELKLSTERNAILKEMLEMQRNMYKSASDREKEAANNKKNNKIRWDDISSGGMPNFEAYFNAVKKNIKTEMGSILPSFSEDGNMLATFFTSPLKYVIQPLVKGLVPATIKAAAKELDSTVSGVFSNIIAELGNRRGEQGLLGFLGKIFGVNTGVNKGIDTSKYEKGPVPFDGITRKAIIDVIPSYLRRIEAYMTGNQEYAFDYKTGKWVTMKSMEAQYKNIHKSAVQSGTSNLREMMDPIQKRMTARNDIDRESLEKAWSEFYEFMFEKNGRFNPNASMDKNDVGFQYPNFRRHYKIIANAYKNAGLNTVSTTGGVRKNRDHSISTKMNVPKDILDAKGNLERQYRMLEDSDGSITMIQYFSSNGTVGIDKHGKYDKDDKFKIKNNLLLLKDDNGYNVYDYLNNINKELTFIRSTSLEDLISITYSSGGGFSGRYGIGGVRSTNVNNDRPQISRLTRESRQTAFKNLNIRSDRATRETESRIERDDRKKQEARKKALDAISRGKAFDISLIENDDDVARYILYLNGLIEEHNSQKYADEIRGYNAGVIDKFMEKNIYNQGVKSINDVRVAAEKAAKEAEKKEAGKTLEEKEQKFINKVFGKIIGERSIIGGIAGASADAFTNLLYSADRAIYEMMYKTEILDSDEDGKPKYNGFMDMITSKITKSFENIKDSAKKNLLDPIKKWLGIDEGKEEDLKNRFTTSLKEIGSSLWKSFVESNKEIWKPVADEAQRQVGLKDGDTIQQKKTKGNIKSSLQSRNDVASMQSMVELMPYFKQYGLNVLDYNNINDARAAVTTAVNKDLFKSAKKLKLYTTSDRDALMHIINLDDNFRNEIAERYGVDTSNKLYNDDAKIKRSIRSAINEVETKEYRELLGANKHITLAKQTGFDVSKLSESDKVNKLISVGVNPQTISSIRDHNEEGEARNLAYAKLWNRLQRDNNFGWNAKGTFGLPFAGNTMLSKGELLFGKGGVFKVPKTDMYHLSEPHHILNSYDGAELTGGNPSGTRADTIAKDLKKEEDIAKAKGFIPTHADGTTDGAKVISAYKVSPKEVFEEAKKNVPEMAAGGLVGGILSLVLGLVGGPLAGAAVGAGASLIKRSGFLKDKLFGKAGEDGERDGGIVSKTVMDAVKKYWPDMKKFGLAGIIPGLLTPLGPIGGLLAGAAIGFAKNNEKFTNKYFGEEGKLTLKSKDKAIIEKMAPRALKGAGIGAAATLLGGPFGIVGNAAVGAALGILTHSVDFKELFLGREIDGKREGGVLGVVKDAFSPLVEAGIDFKDKLIEVVDKNIITPIQEFVTPFLHSLAHVSDSIADKIQNWLNGTFSNLLINPIKDYILAPISNKVKKFVNPIAKGILNVVTSPVRLLGAAGSAIHKRQIKNNTADYQTAAERMDWGGKHGLDAKQSDKVLAAIGSGQEGAMSVDEAEALTNKLSSLIDTESSLGSSLRKQGKDVNSILESYKVDGVGLDPRAKAAIKKALKEGRMDEVPGILQRYGLQGSGAGLTKEQANALLHGDAGLQTSMARYTEILNRKNSFRALDAEGKDKVTGDLQKVLDHYGLNGEFDLSNSRDVKRLISYLQTETIDRKANGKKNAKPFDEGFNDLTIDVRDILNAANRMVDLMEAIVTGEDADLTAIRTIRDGSYKNAVDSMNQEYDNRLADAERILGSETMDELNDDVRDSFTAGQTGRIRSGGRKRVIRGKAAKNAYLMRRKKRVSATDANNTGGNIARIARLKGYGPYEFSEAAAKAITEATDTKFSQIKKVLRNNYLAQLCSPSYEFSEKDIVFIWRNFHKINTFSHVWYNTLSAGYSMDDYKSIEDVYNNKPKSSEDKFNDLLNRVTNNESQDEDIDDDANAPLALPMPTHGIGTFLLGKAGSLAKNAIGGLLNKGKEKVKNTFFSATNALESALGITTIDVAGGGGRGIRVDNLDEVDKPGDGKDIVNVGGGDFIQTRRTSDGSVEPDTSDNKTKSIIDKITKENLLKQKVSEATIKTKEILQKAFDVTNDPASQRGKLNWWQLIIVGGLLWKSGILGKIFNGLIKPLWSDHIKPWITNTAVPWITGTLLPAVGNLLAKVIGSAINLIFRNLPTLIWNGVKGIGTIADYALGNPNNVNATTTVDVSKLSGDTKMVDENGRVLSAEDIANGNYNSIYNTEGAKGTVNEDGTITFKDQSAGGSGFIRKVINAAAHAYANPRSAALAGKALKVVGAVGGRIPIVGKAFSATYGTLGSIVEGAGNASSKAAARRATEKAIKSQSNPFVAHVMREAAEEGAEKTTKSGIKQAIKKATGEAAENKTLTAKIVGFVTDAIEKLFNNKKVLEKMTKVVKFLKIKDAAKFVKEFKNKLLKLLISQIEKGFAKLGKEAAFKAIKGVIKDLPILSIITIVTDFLIGWDRAESLMGVSGSNITVVDKLVAAVINAICEKTIILPIIPGTRIIAKLIYGLFPKSIRGDYEKRQQEADAEYQKFVEESGSTLTKDEYLARKYSTTGKIEGWISDRFNNVKNNVKGFFDNPTEGLKKVGKTMFDTSVVGMVYNADKAIVGWAKDKLPDAAQWASGKLKDFTEWIRNTANKIKEGFANLIQGPMKLINSAIQKVTEFRMYIKEKVDGMLSSVKEWFVDKFGWIKDMFEHPVDFFKNLVFNGGKLNDSSGGVTASGGTHGSTTFIKSNGEIVATGSPTSTSTNTGNKTGILSRIGGAFKSFFGGNRSSTSGGFGALYGLGYSKQTDPSISGIRYNARGDSEYQTIGNSGCGPAAAVNALEAMYGMGSRDIVSAANFAVDRGYKERDGGTKPGFFRDYFNRHGYGSQTTSSKQQLASNIRSGMPTVLMGRDARGTSTSTPYGRTPHYVTVTGTDARGRAIVQDPESKYDNQLYDMNDLLNKSQFGVSTYGRGGKQQQMTHLQMAAISADVVYGQILKYRCKHSFGSKVKEFNEIPKYRTIHCNRAMNLVMQGAGCLGRRQTCGHTHPKGNIWKTGGKNSKSKAIKNYSRLKNCEIYKAMCKYKSLPAKYKQKGVAYIYNSNAAVSGGNGIIYSCNSTGKRYTRSGMIRQRGGYPHNAIILYCIRPDDKIGASCDPNILAHKGISVPEDRSTGSPARIDNTSQNVNGSADAIQDGVDNATDTGAPASTALTFTTTTGEQKTIGGFLADTLANSNIGRILSSFTELSTGATDAPTSDGAEAGGTTVGEDGFSGSSGDIITGSGDFPKYNLNDKQLRGIANILKHEQPGKSGMMAEASQLANLTDKGGNSKATPENIVKKATSGWYRNGSSRYNAGTNDKTAIEAARQVLVEGKRTLPRYVDEHDYLGDIVSVKTNGSSVNKKDVSKYVPHKTVIRNSMGSTYTFYTQPNKNADPFGYTSKELRKKWGDNHYTVDGGTPTSSGGFGSFARYGMGPDDTMAQIGSTLADTLNNSNIGRTLGSILDVGSSSTTSSDASMGDTTSSTGTTASSSSSSSMSVGSGDGADVIRAAQAELGYKEKGENRTKFGEWYGMNGQPWCAMFVSWSANKAGIPTSIIPKYASVKDGFSRIKKMGATKIDKFSDAKAGDIFFNVNGGSHTGLVEGWDGKKLRTIEGNSGDKVSAREYSPGDSAVDYIYRPNYANKSGSSVKISDVTKDGIDPSSYANTRGSNGMKPMSKYGMFRSSLYGKGRSMPPPQKIRVKDANGYFTIETHPEDRMLDLQAKSINNRIRNRYGTGTADTRLINTIINILYSIADNTDKLNTIVAILNSKLGTKITSNDISNNTGMETLKAKLQNSLNNVTNTATSKMNAYADSIGDFSINTVIQAMNAIASE